MNISCLQFQKCGPASILRAVTVAGYGKGTAGNNAMGLNRPNSITVMSNNDLYVADSNNNRIQYFPVNSLVGITVAGDGTSGSGPTQFNISLGFYIDRTTRNVFVADNNNRRIQLWLKNSTSGITILGNNDSIIGYPALVQLDSQLNIYVSEYVEYRIRRWSPNRTNPILIAGNGTSGSTPELLSAPRQFDFDVNFSYIYVADYYNNRIQKWKLAKNGSSPITSGITVAGGNGAGIGQHQLNGPRSVYISKKTNDIYIADSLNHRIQKWIEGDTQGVTIAGSPNGISGIAPDSLTTPAGITIDDNETYLFVSDTYNHRVQRFTLL